MEQPAVPLPLVWSTPLSAHGNTPYRPLVMDGAVIWRSGEVVAQLDAATGVARWTCQLPARSGNGEVLLRCGALTITNGRRRPSNLSSLIAIDGHGRVAWDTALETIVVREGVVAHDGAMTAVGVGPGRGAWMIAVDPVVGTLGTRRALPMGGNALTHVPGGILVRSTSVAKGRAGSYLLEDGGDSRVVAQGACWMAARLDDRLVTLTYDDPAGEITTRVLGSLEVSWRAAVASTAGDADLEGVATIERDHDQATLTLRDLASGDVRWRVDARTSEVVSTVTLAGPVVVTSSLDGRDFFRRADGAWLGRTRAALGRPVADGDRLFIGASGFLLCADVAGI